jgi:hypothetical protein
VEERKQCGLRIQVGAQDETAQGREGARVDALDEGWRTAREDKVERLEVGCAREGSGYQV